MMAFAKVVQFLGKLIEDPFISENTLSNFLLGSLPSRGIQRLPVRQALSRSECGVVFSRELVEGSQERA